MYKQLRSILALTLLSATFLFSCGGGEDAEAAKRKADSIKNDSIAKAAQASDAANAAKEQAKKDSLKNDSMAKVATKGANQKTATPDNKGGKTTTTAPANNGGTKPADNKGAATGGEKGSTFVKKDNATPTLEKKGDAANKTNENSGFKKK